MDQHESDRAATFRVLGEIAGERDRQIDRHGHNPDKDDRQPMSWWGWLLARRATDLSCPVTAVVADDPRRQLLEIASIAVAALESLDRRVAKVDPLGATLLGCSCGFPAQLPDDHRAGCIYSGYPPEVEVNGHTYLNPHYLTVTEDSELVVDDLAEGMPPVIVASYTPADEVDRGEDQPPSLFEAHHYRTHDRPWPPYPHNDPDAGKEPGDPPRKTLPEMGGPKT
ncbi:MAG TPA: hypothetical protein VMW08_00445 [Acidimicrobiales bacterium]|nr:hypothetical protein [Acidimicrobiales bacterium]